MTTVLRAPRDEQKKFNIRICKIVLNINNYRIIIAGNSIVIVSPLRGRGDTGELKFKLLTDE